MTAGDLLEVLRIEATTETPWSAELLASELQRGSGWQYVFQEGERRGILGFIIGTLVLDEAEILKIAVAPEYRRQKIASQLLQKALAFLKTQKAAHCFLELRRSNQAAFNLYQKHGFEVIATRRDYYKDPTEDALIMKKNLNA